MSVKYLVGQASCDVKQQAEKPPHKLFIGKAAILPPASIFVYRNTNTEAHIQLFSHTYLFFFQLYEKWPEVY